MYMSTVSVLMAFILSTVSASQYIQIEKLLFECFFSFNCHTALLVSDIVCLIARCVCINQKGISINKRIAFFNGTGANKSKQEQTVK